MVRIKVVRLSRILYITLALAVLAIALLARSLPSRGATSTSKTAIAIDAGGAWYGQTQAPATAPPFLPGDAAKPFDKNRDKNRDENRDETRGEKGAEVVALVGMLSRTILGVDVTDPRAMLATSGFSADAPLWIDDPEDAAVPAMAGERFETEHEGPSLSPEVITIEIGGQQPFRPPVRAEGLRALIYHTHTEEAYEQVAGDAYVEAAKWRTADQLHSIVRAGSVLAQALAAHGVEVLHETADFEPPKLGYAYERSLAMLEDYTEKGQTFDLYIDLHRDAYSKHWIGEDAGKTTVTIDGKECARIMLLIGDSSAGFKVKSDWKENYKLADALTSQLNEDYPGLARAVMVKTGRYNQHVSPNAILIEVGHNLNTLEEATNTMPYLAEALAKVMGQ